MGADGTSEMGSVFHDTPTGADDVSQEDTITRSHHLKDGQHVTGCPSITTWSAHRLDDASTSDAGTTITIIIVWGHTKPLAAS